MLKVKEFLTLSFSYYHVWSSVLKTFNPLNNLFNNQNILFFTLLTACCVCYSLTTTNENGRVNNRKGAYTWRNVFLFRQKRDKNKWSTVRSQPRTKESGGYRWSPAPWNVSIATPLHRRRYSITSFPSWLQKHIQKYAHLFNLSWGEGEEGRGGETENRHVNVS